MARTDSALVDIRRLRYFVAVCEHGGLSHAARAIGIAQPALTRQIKLLETEIGTDLFTRNGRGAMPNDAGVFLLSEARQHLDGLERAVERLRSDFSEAPARISLGICPTITPLFLDQIGDGMKLGGMAGELGVIEAYSGDLNALLEAGELDLALTYAPSEPAGTFRVKPLLSERLVLATKTAPDAPTVSLHEVGRMKLILPSRMHQLRQIIDSVCGSLNMRLEPALELDSLNTVKALVADGTSQFATILPYHSVADDSAEGAFETRWIEEPRMMRTIALVKQATPRRTLPAQLCERIAARAEEIKRTMEAVF